MKNIISFLIIVFSLVSCAQKIETTKGTKIFTQKVVKQKGTQLVLKKVTNDSRCPEGVNCIWAGECEILISVYKNNKFVKDEKILLSPKLYKANIAWFSKYYPNKKITEINVLPYPKNEVVIDSKDFFVKIMFE
jgi:hypothetical protein